MYGWLQATYVLSHRSATLLPDGLRLLIVHLSSIFAICWHKHYSLAQPKYVAHVQGRVTPQLLLQSMVAARGAKAAAKRRTGKKVWPRRQDDQTPFCVHSDGLSFIIKLRLRAISLRGISMASRLCAPPMLAHELASRLSRV